MTKDHVSPPTKEEVSSAPGPTSLDAGHSPVVRGAQATVHPPRKIVRV